MIKSMTSFGRAESKDSNGSSYIIEIKSVNNRYLDVCIRMPKFMISLEETFKSAISKRIKRGKVDVFINYEGAYSSSNLCKLNLDLAKSYYESLAKIKNEFNLSSDITVSEIASFQDVITVETKEADLDIIQNEALLVLDKALNNMMSMREKEGEMLKKDLLEKLSRIENNVNEIQILSKDFPKDYQKKLEERIKELTGNMTLDEDRIITEVAIFADKSAIDEEIIRLKSHLHQMKKSLDSNEPIGRKLDFIIQEMNRETNTMGSKSCNLQLTNLVIDNKNTLEKIREQVQNIE